MPILVDPKVFLVGYTTADMNGISEYLKYTNKTDFLTSWHAAEGLSDGEKLCSMYAKLCYDSLVLGKNSNITRIRDIPDNLKSIIQTSHLSVFENATVNFIATNVSRIFCNELVRMRAGWAYSQTSGRYCRLDNINFVHDPILDDCKDLEEEHLKATEKLIYLMECRKGLRKAPEKHPNIAAEACYYSDETLQNYLTFQSSHPNKSVDEYRAEIKWQNNTDLKDFTYKKKVTSAIRRNAPDGQSNEIGFSVNFRALRHFVMLRSGRHAEWEMRVVAEEVYKLLKTKFPLLLYDAKEEIIDGILEITGLRMQPYELDSTNPKALKLFSTELLERELNSRYNEI